jgi:3-methyladenine DNA glycosylase AlkD
VGERCTAAAFIERLHAETTEKQRVDYRRFFPGDDSFIGVRMGTVFNFAKECVAMPVGEIERLLESPIHEVRAGACSIMGKSATLKKSTAERREELYELYLRRHDRIDAWDLVDLAAHQVVGNWLVDKPRDPLYELARSDAWPERRTAIVATAAFLRRGEVGDTVVISEILLDDDNDLVHKGAGWMLRYAGEVNQERLIEFLDSHGQRMPRAMLRAAIEKFDKPLRAHYLSLGRS